MSIKNNLNSKFFTILFLAIILVIPLSMIEGVIRERTGYLKTVREDIARSWTGEQLLAGPLLAVPYKVRNLETIWDKSKRTSYQEVKEYWKTFYIAPGRLQTRGKVTTELRYRGIYGVPVYTAQLDLEGEFSTATLAAMVEACDNIVDWGTPYLSLGVSDSRGIANRPVLVWNDRETGFSPSARNPFFEQGLHAELAEVAHDRDASYAFSVRLDLRGMEKLTFTPAGLDNDFRLESDWRHPSFTGRFLPVEHASDEQGFRAQWRVASFGTDIERNLQLANQGQKASFVGQQFGVSLVDPVDIYLQSTRSVKYGFLFVGLTFVAFLLFEVFKRLPIHPVQYTLVGLALSFFYLLLIALSEHIGFAAAYASGTLACSGLLAVYTGAVLRDSRLGAALGGIIAALYAMLYVILRSEDHALLMGSLLLFGIFALVMLFTRHLDWYAVAENMAGLKAGGTPEPKPVSAES